MTTEERILQARAETARWRHRADKSYEISCEAIRRGEMLERALRDIRADEDLIGEYPHLAILIDSALDGKRVA